MDECIQRYVKRNHGLSIGLFDAERIKIEIGAAAPLAEPLEMEISGSGRFPPASPRTIQLTDALIREALDRPLKAIVESIRKALAKTSPELAADIHRRGIVLAGGGSLLKGARDEAPRGNGTSHLQGERTPSPPLSGEPGTCWTTSKISSRCA